ncbi:hypothetical protein EBU94_00705 [bacterium]|nr:hypothetical protein [bacterium]
MKNLLPISKLYNFNAKVFKNNILKMSKTLIVLTVIFFSISLYQKVLAVGIQQVIVDEEYNVFYMGSKTGEGELNQVKVDIGGDMLRQTACYWNGISDLTGKTAYNTRDKKFEVGNYKQFSGKFNDEKVADKGFCLAIPGCNFTDTTTNDSNLNYFAFKKGDREKVIAYREWYGAAVTLFVAPSMVSYTYWEGVYNPLKGFLTWAWTDSVGKGILGTQRWTVQNCNNDLYGSDNKFWTNENGYFSTSCIDSIKNQYGNESDEGKNAHEICRRFICEINLNVRSDIQARTGIEYSCESADECKFRNFEAADVNQSLNGCTYDTNPVTPDTNCGKKNVVRDSDSGWTEERVKDKKIFCAPNNKVVLCEDSFTEYKNVFTEQSEGPGRVKKFTSTLIDPSKCKFFEDITGEPEATCSGSGVQPCNIPAPKDDKDPVSCCFGSGTVSGTSAPVCGATSGAKATNPDSKNSVVKPGHKLYCASDGKVIRCPTARVFIGSPSPVPGIPGIPGVMKNASSLASTNKSDDCEIVTKEDLKRCSLSDSRENCVFGELTSENNCFDKKVVKELDAQNLFCAKNNKVAACPKSIATYEQAFPGTTDRNGPFNKADACQDFEPGSDELIDEIEEDCDIADEGKMFFGEEAIEKTQTDAYTQCIVSKTSTGRENPDDIATECRKTTFGPEAINQSSFKQCFCDVSYNPQYDFFWCNMWPDENKCKKFCKLFDAEFGAVGILEVQEAVSPLNLIKTISDFLFAFAVLIFIINMLRASLLYVTSGGDESKMKEAQSTATNTVFGMIFIVFIGALIRWVISSTGTFISE